MTTSNQYLTKIYDFLTEIGINVVETTITRSTFLPGILIDKGTLAIDPERLLYPGDVLHEAGHIAVTPSAERYLLDDDITKGRPDKQGDELVVLLWTFAACQHIGIPAEVVFHPDGYKGDSQWLLDTFVAKTYIGLPLLVWMGMAKDATADGGFPVMTTLVKAIVRLFAGCKDLFGVWLHDRTRIFMICMIKVYWILLINRATYSGVVLSKIIRYDPFRVTCL